MQHRALGRQGLEVSALGLGTMGMTMAYGPSDEQEGIATIQRAHELGIGVRSRHGGDDEIDRAGFQMRQRVFLRLGDDEGMAAARKKDGDRSALRCAAGRDQDFARTLRAEAAVELSANAL